MDDLLAHQRGGLVRAQARRGGGHHVHELADHRDGGRGALGDQLHHPGEVSVLHREAREVAVDGHQLAKDSVLPVDVPRAFPGSRRVSEPARGRQRVRHDHELYVDGLPVPLWYSTKGA